MAYPNVRAHVSPRVVAGAVSAALHLGVFLVVASSGGQGDGAGASSTPLTQLTLLEAHDADRREGAADAPLQAVAIETLTIDAPELPPDRIQIEAPLISELRTAPTLDKIFSRPATRDSAPDTDALAPATHTLAESERAALEHRLTEMASELDDTQQHVTWEQDGRQYRATLVMERAKEGTDFDRVIADVSATDRGRQLHTRISLKRLPFSHYSQLVDRWDPMVELHDDEIVGRMHVNSQFNVRFGRNHGPVFLGKVTTAARSYSAAAGSSKRIAEIFRGGIETRVKPIELPREAQPFAFAPVELEARIHRFQDDTHIRFFSDGSYSWRARHAKTADYRNEPTHGPVYFLGARGSTLYVQGIVAGKVLVYSAERIVIEGALRYAEDPRRFPDSNNFLGLVSERYVEIAGTHRTGRGDLTIEAAIFAGRRFLVADIDYPRTATLHIYGSLAAGSLGASEPRYATRVEYDARLERLRPPGFPSTDQFAAEHWDGRWNEVPERSAGSSY